MSVSLYKKVTYLCICGDIKTVTEMIAKGIIIKSIIQTKDSLSWALYGACAGGHIELINLLIEHGADSWDYGMMGACERGHYNVMYMMIAKGASDFNTALKGASIGGNMDIINMTLGRNNIDINNLLIGACITNKTQIIEFAIQRGANDWNEAMMNACENGHLDLVKLMIQYGATNWDMGFYNACKYGHLDIINLMMSMGANNFGYGLINACTWNSIETVKLMISLGGNEWSKALKHTYTYSMNFDIIKLLLDSSKGKIQAQDLDGLKESEDVRLYSLYCKYNIDSDGSDNSINPQTDEKFNLLLLTYPPYVALLSKVNNVTKNKQCYMAKLPFELHRLLHECFYNFATNSHCF